MSNTCRSDFLKLGGKLQRARMHLISDRFVTSNTLLVTAPLQAVPRRSKRCSKDGEADVLHANPQHLCCGGAVALQPTRAELHNISVQHPHVEGRHSRPTCAETRTPHWRDAGKLHVSLIVSHGAEWHIVTVRWPRVHVEYNIHIAHPVTVTLTQQQP